MENKYTTLWIKDFNQDNVKAYHQKFYSSYLKNIKHRQQISFIKKFVKDDMYWCDCPIGSGRIFDEIRTSKIIGVDISDEFIRYNTNRGINCIKADLFDLQFKNEFDFVTCLHTISGLEDSKMVIKNLIDSLKSGGILIIDIKNKANVLLNNKKFRKYEWGDGMSRSEIVDFFKLNKCHILSIKCHDYYDNIPFTNWIRTGSPIVRKLKRIQMKVINILYFRLFLYWLFNLWEKTRKEEEFAKYLIAVKKR